MNITELGLSQAGLSRLASVNTSTICRQIASMGVVSMNPGAKKHLYSASSVRKILRNIFKNRGGVDKKIQSFYNFKGGTGKTSVCFQVSTHLALHGYNVLVVDSDPQGHLSTLLGFNSLDSFMTLYDIIAEGVNISHVIKPVFEGLDCIPANLSLTRVILPLDQMTKREEVVKNVFSSIEDKYDFILFDTNPTISTLNRNVMVYSDIINVVCETQPLSMNGLKILFDDLKKFFNLMRMPFPNLFIIPNKYEDKSSSSAECMSALRSFYPEYVKPDVAIRRSEDMITASKFGLPVSCFARKNSNALEDIIQIVNEIVENSRISPAMNKDVAHG